MIPPWHDAPPAAGAPPPAAKSRRQLRAGACRLPLRACPSCSEQLRAARTFGVCGTTADDCPGGGRPSRGRESRGSVLDAAQQVGWQRDIKLLRVRKPEARHELHELLLRLRQARIRARLL